MRDQSVDRTYMEAAFETMTQPFVALDGDLRVESANPAFLRQFEVREEETTGTLIYDLGNGQWDIPDLHRLLEDVLDENDRVEDYRVEHDFEQIGRRIMLLNGNRVRREGEADSILLAFTDITEAERLRADLKGRIEFADKLIASVRESILILYPDLRVQVANEPFYDLFGGRPEETEERMVYDLGNGQWDIPELRELLERILPEKRTFDDYEVEHEFEHIGRRIMVLNARRLDHIDFVILAIRDVTEQRQHERRQSTMMGEMRHRVKNILSNVSALAQRTSRDSRSVAQFLDGFQARLGALARAQDLLIKNAEEDISLGDVVRLELEAVGAERDRDFTADGPLVCLPSREAQTMGMVAHELTTNAAKYGALKSDAGRIEITWRTEARNDKSDVCFTWRERGVRIGETKPAKGFGSTVIEESLPHMIGGTSSLVFHPDGAECRIEFPTPERPERGGAGE